MMETVECLKKISSKIVQYSTVTQMKLLTTTLRIYNNDSFYLFIYFTCMVRATKNFPEVNGCKIVNF